jgi:hypothetical protein
VNSLDDRPPGPRRAAAARLGLLLLAGVAIAARAPDLLRQPRFWAEEATVYFVSAVRSSWLEALAAPHLGYYSLYANLATALAAHTVPLEHAPLVTTLAAIVAQLLPVGVILGGRIRFLADLPRQTIGVAIVLLTPPSLEIWLNSPNSQFFLALTTCLLLLEDAERQPPGSRWTRRIVLIVAGLTGPVSGALTLVAWWRAWLRPGREARIHGIILAACVGVQALALLSAPAELDAEARLGGFDPATSAAIWATRAVAEPLVGTDRATNLARAVHAFRERSPAHARALGLALGAAVALLLTILAGGSRSPGVFLLLASYLLVTALSIVTALGTPKEALIRIGASGRYFYISGVLLNLLVLTALDGSFRRLGRSRRWLACLLLGFSLLVNATHFRSRLLAPPERPDWRTEVATWRRDPRHRLRVWPSGWTISLSPDPVRQRTD